MEPIKYPVRLNRYLSLKGYCGRREADTFIERGLVKINGKAAKLGQKVLENDKVEVLGKLKRLEETYAYYIFNKPVDIVVEEPQGKEVSVKDIFPTKEEVVPVGRLDKDSEGLMLLTNDKRIIKKVTEPQYDHEKEYVVTVDKPVTQTFLNRIAKGIDIEGYFTKPAKSEKLDERVFSIILTEGKKHQIRRMCAAGGYQVRKLRRTRIMHLKLGGLKKGEGRPLTDFERNVLLKSAGLV